MASFLFRRKEHVLIAVGILYALALATPALVFARGFDGGTKWGIECLVGGPLLVLGMRPGWLANIPLLLGVVAFALDKFRAAAWLGLGAAVLSLTTLTFYLDEGTILSPPFLHPHVGFYLWVASMLTLSFGALTEGTGTPRRRSRSCTGSSCRRRFVRRRPRST